MKIELNSGREIFLHEIYQYQTYMGLLCGVPTKRMNQRRMKSSLEEAENKMKPDKIYLVPPPILEVNVSKNIAENYPEAERIPYITCFAEFGSSGLKEDDGYASWLTIVWYQDEFALPIDDAVIEHIKTIDWEHEAEGYDF